VTKQSGLTIADGTISLTNASLLTVELSSVYLFVGLNGAFTRDADNIVTGLDTTQAVGFGVSGASLDLAIVSEATPGTRSWTGVAAHVGLMSVYGLRRALR